MLAGEVLSGNFSIDFSDLISVISAFFGVPVQSEYRQSIKSFALYFLFSKTNMATNYFWNTFGF